jgi:hypothetical protein
VMVVAGFDVTTNALMPLETHAQPLLASRVSQRKRSGNVSADP